MANRDDARTRVLARLEQLVDDVRGQSEELSRGPYAAVSSWSLNSRLRVDLAAPVPDPRAAPEIQSAAAPA